MSNNWFANEEVADKVKKELLELVPAKQIAKNVGCTFIWLQLALLAALKDELAIY